MNITAAHGLSPKLLMGHSAPELTVQMLTGETWSLAQQSPKTYTMVLFYRGLHCPICVQYLNQLEKKLEVFSKMGVEAIAISGDTLEKTQQFQAQANLNHLALGYGLKPEAMRRWGLYLSKGHFEKEPALFSEPALFLIKPDGRLYLGDIGTHPFARIDLDRLAKGLEFVIAANYPFRGTE